MVARVEHALVAGVAGNFKPSHSLIVSRAAPSFPSRRHRFRALFSSEQRTDETVRKRNITGAYVPPLALQKRTTFLRPPPIDGLVSRNFF